MAARANRVLARKRRHVRLRTKLRGTSEKPRLNVFRSSCHIYAQVIDDDSGCTVVACSTLDPEVSVEAKGKEKAVGAGLVGSLVAKRAREHGVTTVAFDRGGYKYHGRVKALAEAARKEGLTF